MNTPTLSAKPDNLHRDDHPLHVDRAVRGISYGPGIVVARRMWTGDTAGGSHYVSRERGDYNRARAPHPDGAGH